MLTIRVHTRRMVFDVPVAPRAVTVVPADPWGEYRAAISAVTNALLPDGFEPRTGVELTDAWVPTHGFIKRVTIVSEVIAGRRVEDVELLSPPVRLRPGSVIHARIGAVDGAVCADIHGGVKCISVDEEGGDVEAAGYLAFAAAARLLANVEKPVLTPRHVRILEVIGELGFEDTEMVNADPLEDDVYVVSVNPHPEAVEHVATMLYTLASAGATVVAFTPRPGELQAALRMVAAGGARLLERGLLGDLARLPRPSLLQGSRRSRRQTRDGRVDEEAAVEA